MAALEGDEIQVALLFTSDGVISAKGFVLLEDDEGLQPAENLTPVIRQDIIDELKTYYQTQALKEIA